MRRSVPVDLQRQAKEAFLAYEGAYVDRIAKKPGWRLSAQPLQDVLASGDEATVRAYMEELRRGCDDILSGMVV